METEKQRERLVELIQEGKSHAFCDICEGRSDCENCENERIADYLMSNNVVVLPWKVGQIVYILRSKTSNGKNLYLTEERISHYRVFENWSFMCFESARLSVAEYLWETTVFTERAEAENALKERKE